MIMGNYGIDVLVNIFCLSGLKLKEGFVCCLFHLSFVCLSAQPFVHLLSVIFLHFKEMLDDLNWVFHFLNFTYVTKNGQFLFFLKEILSTLFLKHDDIGSLARYIIYLHTVQIQVYLPLLSISVSQMLHQISAIHYLSCVYFE